MIQCMYHIRTLLLIYTLLKKVFTFMLSTVLDADFICSVKPVFRHKCCIADTDCKMINIWRKNKTVPLHYASLRQDMNNTSFRAKLQQL